MFRSTRSRLLVCLVAALVAAMAVVFAVRLSMGHLSQLEAREGEIADFSALAPQAANRFLMCPKNYCNVPPDAASPVFDLPWEALRDRWSEMVAGQRGVRLVAGDGDLGKITYIQRSLVLHLPDVITIQFVPLGDSRSTFALVSQSRYDVPDLGANRLRVEDWVRRLKR
ncbi:MAG TPA: DUF1499 domain-containing protein [Stellaceae bacterium]|nr:DUF1499 domain-containing protein [Stellaceae bacterium]